MPSQARQTRAHTIRQSVAAIPAAPSHSMFTTARGASDRGSSTLRPQAAGKVVQLKLKRSNKRSEATWPQVAATTLQLWGPTQPRSAEEGMSNRARGQARVVIQGAPCVLARLLGSLSCAKRVAALFNKDERQQVGLTGCVLPLTRSTHQSDAAPSRGWGSSNAAQHVAVLWNGKTSGRCRGVHPPLKKHLLKPSKHERMLRQVFPKTG